MNTVYPPICGFSFLENPSTNRVKVHKSSLVGVSFLLYVLVLVQIFEKKVNFQLELLINRITAKKNAFKRSKKRRE